MTSKIPPSGNSKTTKMQIVTQTKMNPTAEAHTLLVTPSLLEKVTDDTEVLLVKLNLKHPAPTATVYKSTAQT